MFKQYDLEELGIPQEAWPNPSRQNLGQRSYTLVAPTTNAVFWAKLKTPNYQLISFQLGAITGFGLKH